MATNTSEPVAITKLQLPRIAAGALLRSSLLDRIESETGRLLLLSAPAGWGKTTLLGQFCKHRSATGLVACAALDRWDDDANRFWRTFLAALSHAGLGSDIAVPIGPGATGPGLLASLMPGIINELAGTGSPVTVVLDDFHHVTDTQVHEGVGYLLENLPDRHQIVIATRHDPPLALAKLRAKRDLIEVRATDLALTTDELVSVVGSVAGVGLEADDAQRLHRRTEGWPVGVHLAALSLRGHSDPAAAISDFEGDHRHVADYLTSEVLSQVPEALKDFLLRCSILDRLEPDLCIAVTGDANALNLLRQAEDLNLFLVPLDHRRVGYRFHRLFVDWLHHRLLLDSPEEVPKLHRRAMEWYRTKGSPARAIDHAIVGGCIEDARQLILAHGGDLTAQGRVATLAGWLNAMPHDVVAADPVLSIAAAAVLATDGQPDRADTFLDAAEEALAAGAPVEVPLAPDVEIAATRATVAMVRRDLAAAVLLARRAAALETDPTRERFGIGHAVLGSALFWTAEAGAARAVIDEVWSEVSTVFVKLLCAGVLAASCLETGEIDRAESVARFALSLAADRHVGPAPEMALVHLALGGALTARGLIAEAEEELATGIEQSRWWRVPAQEAYGNMLLAQIRLTQGDRGAAQDLLRRVGPTVESARTMGVLARTARRLESGLRSRRMGRSNAGAAGELTDRERDVLRLLASQLTQREIGRHLDMTVNTVKSHTQNLYRKLGVSSRADAVAKARSLHLS